MQHLLRRKVIFIVLAIVCPLVGLCQFGTQINQPDHDTKLFHFGINVGINRSHFSITHHPRFLYLPNGNTNDTVTAIESLNSTGINLAWLVNLNLSEHWDIRTTPLNLTFTERVLEYNLTYPDGPGGEAPVTQKKLQSITLTLPLELKFSSDRIDNFKVYMLAGIKGEYDLASNAGARKAEDLIKLKKFDYGLEAGFGFHFYFPMFVLTPELKVGWGLGNLHSRDENLKFSNVIDKINSRMLSFSLTVE